MIAYSGFNGFGQFGSTSQHRAATFAEFPLPQFLSTHAEQDDILVAPSWSYTAYARGAHLLLCGFLTDAADARLELTASSNIKQLATSDRFCLILLENGQLFKVLPLRNATLEQIKFATDETLQTLPQKRTIFGTPKPLEYFEITHVACGANISVAISNTNAVYNVPSKVFQFPKNVRVQQLICGFEHSLLLTTNGDVHSWGNGLRGQLGKDVLCSEECPQLVEALAGIKIISIAAGGWHSAAISSFGDIYTWGYNSNGQLGLPFLKQTSTGVVKQPKVYPLPQIVDMPPCSCRLSVQQQTASDSIDDGCVPIKVFAGARHTIVRMSCDAILASGWNSHGQLSLSCDKDSYDIFERITCLNSNDEISEIICGSWCTVIKKKYQAKADNC